MSKFNEMQPNVNTPDTINAAGGTAFSMSPELELATTVVTAMLEDKYYNTSTETMNRMRKLMGIIPDKKFIAQTAIYARLNFGMRSVSHLIAAEIAKMPEVKGTPWIKNFYNKVVSRADDMTEIISAIGAKNIPNALKRGFAQKLTTFDEYTLAKYAGKGKSVNMIDVVRLVHPKPTPAITKLVNGTLAAPDTWEVKLTQAGQNSSNETELAENKAEAWKELIVSKKIGYFALLKNLRNISELLSNDTEAIDAAVAMLTNPKLVANSKLFPFRFYTAVRELTAAGADRRLISAANKALELSVSNVPHFTGKTLVIVDISGSMSIQLSRRGTVSCSEAAGVFAAALYKSNDCDIIKFGSDAKYITPNPDDSISTIASMFSPNGAATNVQGAFNLVNKQYDRIILLSDMQAWIQDNKIPGAGRPGYGYGWGREAVANDVVPALRKRTNSDPYVYSFDLAGYGTLQFPEEKVACLAGYSDKVFDIMSYYEEDKQSIVDEIRKVVL